MFELKVLNELRWYINDVLYVLKLLELLSIIIAVYLPHCTHFSTIYYISLQTMYASYVPFFYPES